MTQDSLMQRMIAAGVDIMNPQAVFDFYHNQDNATPIDFNLLKNYVNTWIADAILGKADKADLDLKADLAALENKVNRNELQAYALKDDLSNKADQSAVSALDAVKADKDAVNQQLDSKLNRSEFHQHFRGLFTTAQALHEHVTDAVAGDYAHVDAGEGEPTEIHAYDVNDRIWRKQGSNGLSVTSTDSIPEGNSNLYFQAERVKSVVKGMNSGELPEGANLYFTDARVSAVVGPMITPIQNQIGEIDQLLTQLLGV